MPAPNPLAKERDKRAIPPLNDYGPDDPLPSEGGMDPFYRGAGPAIGADAILPDETDGDVSALQSDNSERIKRVRAFMKRMGLSQGQLSGKTGMPGSTLSQLLADKYRGDSERRWIQLERYMDDHGQREHYQAKLGYVPAHVTTPTGKMLKSIFDYCRFGPEMAAIVGQPGLGKTQEALAYTSESHRVIMTTGAPSKASATHAIRELCVAAGLGYTIKSVEARAQLTEYLNYDNSLIIVDEAQHLSVNALEELRHLHDMTKCGVVLMGNQSILTRIDGGARRAEFAQLSSRFGFRKVLPKKPLDGDVDALLNAMSITDKKERSLLHGEAMKPGALRLMMKVYKSARMQQQEGDGVPFYDRLRTARSMFAQGGVA